MKVLPEKEVVYVLFYGYEDVVGVFSTYEKAQAVINNPPETYKWQLQFSVLEMVLDELYADKAA